MNDSFRLLSRSWRFLAERSYLTLQRFLAFLRRLRKRPWRRYAHSFKRIWLHDLRLPPHQVGYGTGRAIIGQLWMLMAPNRHLVNGRFLRQQIFLLLTAAL